MILTVTSLDPVDHLDLGQVALEVHLGLNHRVLLHLDHHLAHFALGHSQVLLLPLRPPLELVLELLRQSVVLFLLLHHVLHLLGEEALAQALVHAVLPDLLRLHGLVQRLARDLLLLHLLRELGHLEQEVDALEGVLGVKGFYIVRVFLAQIALVRVEHLSSLEL